ncbi:hypothetical protein Gpo141_00009819 [Globisporangium polare]
MALQTIRYGGGVWKQHEKLRLKLEAQVTEYEQQLAAQQQTLASSQAANEKLQSELTASQSHASELHELLQTSIQEADGLRVALVDANQRQADTDRCVQQLRSRMDVLNSLCERQKELLREHTSRISRLELQVDASRDEELRLCELLYEAQEKNEGHEVELTELQRELRITTRASHVKTKQVDALVKENAALAQRLAQLRGANPKVHFAPPVKAQKSSSNTIENEPRATVKRQTTANDTKSNQQSPSPSAGLLWRELQLMSAKVRTEQHENAKLRDCIDALEAHERALTVRFREAAAARQRAEKISTRRAL